MPATVRAASMRSSFIDYLQNDMINVDVLPLETMLAAAVQAYARACMRPSGQRSGSMLWRGRYQREKR